MIRIHRADGRFRTEEDGRSTRHSFSFGPHYDPDNLGFGAMIAFNDEHLPVGTGYPDHPHAHTEIVTWVLNGALEHRDTAGHHGVLGSGEIQVVSAGDGIVHSETAAPGTATRFLQTWLRPDVPGGRPSYARTLADPSGLTEVVGPGGLPVAVSGARLLLGPVAGRCELPDAALLHVFVVDGVLRLGEQLLGPGDAVRLSGESPDLDVLEPGAVAVWAFRR